MKIKLYKSVALCSLLALAGCHDFEELNTNPYAPIYDPTVENVSADGIDIDYTLTEHAMASLKGMEGAIGSIFALMITIVFYVVRRILSFKKCMDCLPEGFKAMVPAILILTFAWTLKNMTSSLGAAEYVGGIMKHSATGFAIFLPAVIFVVGCGLAFATGTSWGTFGILIPIVVQAFQKTDPAMMIIAISACMAGAVCGDHCSPISDTTIMSSAGAQCEHTNHVSTQIPYAATVAVISFITYIIAGALQKAAGLGWLALPIGIVLMIGTVVGIKVLTAGKEATE